MSTFEYRKSKGHSRKIRSDYYRKQAQWYIREHALELKRDGASKRFPRREMTDAEIQSAIEHLANVNLAKFSMKMYAPVDVNTCFKNQSNGKKTTLIDLSAGFRRVRNHAMTSGLIKLGGIPGCHSIGNTRLKGEIMLYLMEKVTSPFAVYIVNSVVAMRWDEKTVCCCCCGGGGGSKEDNGMMMRWPRCNHTVCETCFWTYRVKHARSENLRSCQLRCLKCDILYDDKDEIAVLRVNLSKNESLSLFRSLPMNVTSNNETKKKKKRPRFRALSFYNTLRLYIGENQVSRKASFERALSNGNVPKIVMLLNSGVDLDFRDEYGLTPLMNACLNNMPYCRDLLLRAGADLNLKANDGTSALEIMNLTKTSLTYDDDDNDDDDDDDDETKDEEHAVQPIVIRPKEYLGTIVIDQGFTETFLNRLYRYFKTLPKHPPAKTSCTTRRYLYDIDGSICETIERLVRHVISCSKTFVFRKFRVLSYDYVDGFVPPHVDLNRVNRDGVRSTHTLILYLSDCERGGETRMMHRLPNQRRKYHDDVFDHNEKKVSSSSSSSFQYDVKPRRGRLLLFPHLQPHEGRPTIDCPKIFLRGEMFIESQVLPSEPTVVVRN